MLWPLRKQVPPLVYPLFATLVWYSVRLLLRVPRVRGWAFALENHLAVCGDDQQLSHWHLSRARASKAYAGAEGIEFSAIALRGGHCGLRLVFFELPLSAVHSCPSLLCDAMHMSPNSRAPPPVLFVMCDEGTMSDCVCANLLRSGYFVCAHALLGGVVAAPSHRGAVSFDVRRGGGGGGVAASVWVELQIAGVNTAEVFNSFPKSYTPFH